MGSDYRWRHRACHNFDVVLLNCIIGALAIGAYGLNRWVLKPVTKHWFLHCYLNDMLAPIVLLAWANFLISASSRTDYLIRRVAPALALVGGAGLYWEYVTPLYRAAATTDSMDLVVYAIGGIIYVWLFAMAHRICSMGEPAKLRSNTCSQELQEGGNK